MTNNKAAFKQSLAWDIFVGKNPDFSFFPNLQGNQSLLSASLGTVQAVTFLLSVTLSETA